MDVEVEAMGVSKVLAVREVKGGGGGGGQGLYQLAAAMQSL
jgi:hypothetical protein